MKGHVGIFVPTNKKQRMSILSSGNIKRKATNSPKSNEIKINSPKSNEIKVQVVAEEESPRSEERKNIRRKSATKANLLNMQMLTRGSGSKSSLNLFQQSPARAIKEEEEDVSSSEMGTIESIDDDAYAVNDMLRAGFIEVANVFDGGSFGELALLTNKPRYVYIYIYIYIYHTTHLEQHQSLLERNLIVLLSPDQILSPYSEKLKKGHLWRSLNSSMHCPILICVQYVLYKDSNSISLKRHLKNTKLYSDKVILILVSIL